MRRSSAFHKHESLSGGCWRTVSACAIMVLAFSTASPRDLAAQTSTGSIRGYVRDTRDSAVTSAQVIARSTDMGITRGALSNAAGFYSIAGLRPGSWSIEVRRIGLAPQTRTRKRTQQTSEEFGGSRNQQGEFSCSWNCFNSNFLPSYPAGTIAPLV